jgi:hypothetical protein
MQRWKRRLCGKIIATLLKDIPMICVNFIMTVIMASETRK